MDQDEIFNKVKEIIQNQMMKKKLTLHIESLLNEIEGWDSLKHVMVVADIENAFDIKINFLELLNLRTVGDICQTVMQHKEQA
jgi:acyl carrier protein